MNSVLAAIALFTLSACASVSERIADAQPYSDMINWPDEYLPEDADFYVHNKIEIDAEPEVIWQILIDAENWPDWYRGAFDVAITNSPSPVLLSDSVFTWNTMGLDFTSVITEFDAPYRLSWVSERSFIKGYHAWLIIPGENGATLLVTDESQTGFFAHLQSIFQKDKLRDLHDEWLLQIKRKAEA